MNTNRKQHNSDSFYTRHPKLTPIIVVVVFVAAAVLMGWNY